MGSNKRLVTALCHRKPSVLSPPPSRKKVLFLGVMRSSGRYAPARNDTSGNNKLFETLSPFLFWPAEGVIDGHEISGRGRIAFTAWCGVEKRQREGFTQTVLVIF
ncbi:hypothetical protein JTE90_018502 [Oedothorax gibbosus]|uniref:Uncharacterized protein n=1 Tax=Oedothorax gibbosus TaxID=931172 RepID=A0AAV6V0N6_9ARAC|nr:hypothetical protein JTE90_018502 [Oedothorax gibbosus]